MAVMEASDTKYGEKQTFQLSKLLKFAEANHSHELLFIQRGEKCSKNES